jgi:hypothetical protein
MFEPQFLPERYPSRWFKLRTAARSGLRRFGRIAEAATRRAMATPAKSALLTLALGAVAGSIVRIVLVRHSGPNQAAAAYRSATQPSDPHPSR